jgi:hypothetical protein
MSCAIWSTNLRCSVLALGRGAISFMAITLSRGAFDPQEMAPGQPNERR